MKTRRLLLSAPVILLCMIPFGANAQDKYIPKANEEGYGIWTNEQSKGSLFRPQKVVVTPDGYKAYCNISDSLPCEEGMLGIASKWSDPEGNTWYKAFGTITTGVRKGLRFQELIEISKSGTISESVSKPIFIGGFDPSNYPTKIDPKNSSYRIRFRAEK